MARLRLDPRADIDALTAVLFQMLGDGQFYK